jgi:hypothetical protein
MRAPWDMNLHVLKVEKSKNVHERVTIKGDSKQQQSKYIYIYVFDRFQQEYCQEKFTS